MSRSDERGFKQESLSKAARNSQQLKSFENEYQSNLRSLSMKRNGLLSAITVLALLGAVLAATPKRAAAGESSAVEIKIDNFSFGPQTVTVTSGTHVTWVNQDDIPHTVVSDDKTTFKSHALDTDEKFSFTFSKPGTYNYFCSIHPKMTAKVVVQ
jgi:plastocyanin